jgi:hypothetical protein
MQREEIWMWHPEFNSSSYHFPGGSRMQQGSVYKSGFFLFFLFFVFFKSLCFELRICKSGTILLYYLSHDFTTFSCGYFCPDKPGPWFSNFKLPAVPEWQACAWWDFFFPLASGFTNFLAWTGLKLWLLMSASQLSRITVLSVGAQL